MNELMLKFDYECIDKNIIEYLLSLEGIIEVKINNLENELYIKYNQNTISLKLIKLEILLFLGTKIPDIIEFDKYSKAILTKTNIIIKDLCCEYCLKSMIEELLLIKGIEKVSTNFDSFNKKDVILNIKYDKELISKEDIKILEDKFNKGAKDD